MRVYIGTYHGSVDEISAVERAGYKIPDGKMHIDGYVDGDPFEIAEKIHSGKGGSVKVAVGEFFYIDDRDVDGEVTVYVSDDWFRQR